MKKRFTSFLKLTEITTQATFSGQFIRYWCFAFCLLLSAQAFATEDSFTAAHQIEILEVRKNQEPSKLRDIKTEKNSEESPLKESLILSGGVLTGGLLGVATTAGMFGVASQMSVTGEMVSLIALMAIPFGLTAGLLTAWLIASDLNISSFLTRVPPVLMVGLVSSFIGAALGLFIGGPILTYFFADTNSIVVGDFSLFIAGAMGGAVLGGIAGAALTAAGVPLLDAVVE